MALLAVTCSNVFCLQRSVKVSMEKKVCRQCRNGSSTTIRNDLTRNDMWERWGIVVIVVSLGHGVPVAYRSISLTLTPKCKINDGAAEHVTLHREMRCQL